MQARSYCVDETLPAPDKCNMRVDHWWALVAKTNKYDLLVKCVNAVLSCFHGPLIEGTFSVMSNVLDDRSSRMQIETYSAIQMVKHELVVQGMSSIQTFHHADPMHATISGELCQNMRNVYQAYVNHKECKKNDREILLKQQGITTSNIKPLSKTKAKDISLQKVSGN